MDNLETLIAAVPCPEPSEALDRRMELLLAESRPAPAQRSYRRRWLAGLAAAAAVAAVCWLFSEPGVSLAQMQAAVQSKPWVHLTRKGLPADAPERHEIWLSVPRDVIATVDNGMIRYTDLRLGTITDYVAKRKQLVRVPAGQFDSYWAQSEMSFLSSIFRIEGPVGQQFGRNRIVGRKQRLVEEDGRKWREYEIELERGEATKKSTLTIRVDPETNLPATMKATASEGSIEFAFDYPAEGPADIYALGVPRDTPLEDRMPTDDLKRVQAALAIGNRELDKYFAASGRNGLIEWLFWRRGEKWRFALCTPPLDRNEILGEQSDLSAWWQKRLQQVPPEPVLVCDGQRVYRCKTEAQPNGTKQENWSVERTLNGNPEAGHFAANMCIPGTEPSLVELAVYPTPEPGPRGKLLFDPTGADGPDGTVRLQVMFDGSVGGSYVADFGRRSWWLDPQHGYAAVKDQSFSEGHALDQWDVYDDFLQSPRGIWYPTLMVRTRLWTQKLAEQRIRERGMFVRKGKQAAGRDPKIEQDAANPAVWREETETRWFLDFTVDWPNELFKPE